MNIGNSKRRVKMMVSAFTGVFLTAVLIVSIASGVFLEKRYLEPWQSDYSDQFDDPRIKLAAHGILAANGHNMQPWKIKLDSDPKVFYLFADSERLTKEVDPYARQTMISQGTFLEYVQVAASELGYRTEMVLFPDGNYDEQNLSESMKIKPVARITLSKAEPQDSSLYEYMFLSDTHRGAYAQQELSSEEIQQLLAINPDSEVKILILQDEANKKNLGNYAVAGARIESDNHRINEESAKIFRINEYKKNKYRYGFSVEGQGTSGIQKHILQGLLTLIPAINNEKSAADLFVKSTQAAVEHTPAYALILTKKNSRIEQVKSGMLYSRLVLNAHSLGLVMQPPSQVLEEYPEMREQYQKIHNDYAPEGGTIQMLFRMGKTDQEFPRSMRRDVMDLVE